jgi:anti-sigma factor RsiW
MRAEDCDKLAESLSQLLAGELSPGAAAMVEGHLASCEPCARRRAALERTATLLRGAFAPGPSELEWARLEATARRSSRVRIPLLAVAAVLLTLLLPATLYATLKPYHGGASFDATSDVDVDL